MIAANRNININVDSKIKEIIDKISGEPEKDLDFYNEIAFLYDYLYGREYDLEGQTKLVDENIDRENIGYMMRYRKAYQQYNY